MTRKWALLWQFRCCKCTFVCVCAAVSPFGLYLCFIFRFELLKIRKKLYSTKLGENGLQQGRQ